MIIGGIIVAQVTTPTVVARRRYGYCRDRDGNPLVKRVILFDHRTGAYIASTTSTASTGYWEIRGLPSDIANNTIMEIAIDDTMTYDSVVRNHKSLVI